MSIVDLPIFGPSHTNRSLRVGAQVTRNFYPELNELSGEPTSLMPFPGLKSFANVSPSSNRGMGIFGNELYTISGTTLYKVASDATVTSIGTIAGTDRCVLTDAGLELVITNGFTNPYSYDGTTLTQGVNTNLTTSKYSAYINSRVVYDGLGGQLIFADLNDALSIDSANILVTEARPDDVEGVWSFRNNVYAGGDKSIQPYWNSGSGNPPYDPILNAIQDVGIHSSTVATSRDYTYLLGRDKNVYQYDGLTLRPIGNPAVCQSISTYTSVSDAYGVCFSFDSLDFYLLSFPTGNETWLFSDNTKLWTNLTYGTEGGQHLISDYQFIYGKHLVSDRRNGNIYELDFDTYTDNGDVIQRQRDTISLSAKNLGLTGRSVVMNSLELLIEPGASLVSGSATVIMQYSDDNGRSWSSELWSSIGQQGDYEYRVRWFQLGRFRNRMIRFRMTDPINWVIVGARADVEVGID